MLHLGVKGVDDDDDDDIQRTKYNTGGSTCNEDYELENKDRGKASLKEDC
jgi:hypothetical protein